MLAKDLNREVVLVRSLKITLMKSDGLLERAKKLEIMKKKKAKKSIDIPDIMTPETQEYLDQLDMIDKQFIFYANECDKLEKEFTVLQEDEKYSSELDRKQSELSRKFLELGARYERDKITFDSLVKKISSFFQQKYGITINFDL